MPNALQVISELSSGIVESWKKSLYHIGSKDIRGRSAVDIGNGFAVSVAMQADEGEKIELLGSDNKKVPATVKGFDSASGLVLLELETKSAKTPEFAKNLPQVGELAISVAFASPEGVEAHLDMVRCVGGDGTYFQTDGQAFPGFSGAAVLAADGALLGLVTGNHQGNHGLISPIAEVLRIVEGIKAHGSTKRAWLGIYVEDLRLDNPVNGPDGEQKKGLLVRQVETDSPAGKAGLSQGDILVSLNGEALTNAFKFRALLEKLRAGDLVKLELVRSGKPIHLDVTSGERPKGE